MWFTKKITRIGENSAKNSSENQDGLLPPWSALGISRGQVNDSNQIDIDKKSELEKKSPGQILDALEFCTATEALQVIKPL